eukprot:1900859-Pleurochrysis_carterae.AAC.1
MLGKVIGANKRAVLTSRASERPSRRASQRASKCSTPAFQQPQFRAHLQHRVHRFRRGRPRRRAAPHRLPPRPT